MKRLKSKDGRAAAENKVSEKALDLHMRKVASLVASRDLVGDWLQELTNERDHGIGRLSSLELHLILLEENALRQLAAALNARAGLLRVLSVDLDGNVLRETGEQELEFLLGASRIRKVRKVRKDRKGRSVRQEKAGKAERG